MDENAHRHEDGPEQPERYWHRRAVILIAGVGVIGLLAWALAPGGGKPGGPAARASHAPGALSAGADRSTTDRSAAAASPGARAGTASASTGTSVPSAATGTSPGGRCSPGAVVLSLFTRPDFPVGQNPAFDVDAVSTAPGTCTFDPGQLQLLVMSDGRIIWDSADCSHDGIQPGLLTRGIPLQESITWNRTITLPGCVTLASARPGTYQAQAKAGTLASPVRTFRLGR